MLSTQTDRCSDQEELPTPTIGNKVHYDSEQKGFGVRITAAGARSFILNYRVKSTGRERRYTIGGFSSWSATSARAEARRLQQEIDRGADPVGEIEQQREAPTVADLIERYKEEHFPRLRLGSQYEYSMQLKKWIEPHFGKHLKVADVGYADVDALHRKITKSEAPIAANRAISLLRGMFKLAIRWRWIEKNPATGIVRNREHRRQRYLTGEELGRLTVALAAHSDRQSANIIRMLLLTGARRGEVQSMRWQDVDTEGRWNKPAFLTKQKTAHSVPLSAPARQLLAGLDHSGDWVFPSSGASGHRRSIQKQWRKICSAAKITGVTLHDLRHSFASQLVSSGASLPLIGALLGHSNPQTTARYAHLFDDPLKRAVESVGAVIESAGKPDADNVEIKGHRRA